MSRGEIGRSQQLLSAASARMVEALQILDQIGCPGQIGSHLDLAIARIQEQSRLSTPPETLGNCLAGGPLPGPNRRSDPPSPWDIPSV